MQPTFSDDVSIHFRTAGERHLPPAGTPKLRMLEIGVHEGRSACWFLARHPESTYLGIDPWKGKQGVYERARKNLSGFGSADLIRAESFRALPWLSPRIESFDVIHVDGLHTVEVALLDGLLCWPLLAPGGLMAFDDLLHGDRPCVQEAFDLFVRAVTGGAGGVLERARQGWVRKAEVTAS